MFPAAINVASNALTVYLVRRSEGPLNYLLTEELGQRGTLASKSGGIVPGDAAQRR